MAGLSGLTKSTAIPSLDASSCDTLLAHAPVCFVLVQGSGPQGTQNCASIQGVDEGSKRGPNQRQQGMCLSPGSIHASVFETQCSYPLSTPPTPPIYVSIHPSIYLCLYLSLLIHTYAALHVVGAISIHEGTKIGAFRLHKVRELATRVAARGFGLGFVLQIPGRGLKNDPDGRCEPCQLRTCFNMYLNTDKQGSIRKKKQIICIYIRRNTCICIYIYIHICRQETCICIYIYIHMCLSHHCQRLRTSQSLNPAPYTILTEGLRSAGPKPKGAQARGR